jgi:hypothetical protein
VAWRKSQLQRLKPIEVANTSGTAETGCGKMQPNEEEASFRG